MPVLCTAFPSKTMAAADAGGNQELVVDAKAAMLQRSESKLLARIESKLLASRFWSSVSFALATPYLGLK